MMLTLSSEVRTLVKRLKDCDVEEIIKNPNIMLAYYPIRDPDSQITIFDEIYPLLDYNLLGRTYKSRIFFYLNTCLSSIKVPAHVIAAYIKKLSRLTLKAKPRTLVTILRLVGNLFVRHPTLLFLRDKVDDKAREAEVKTNTCTLQDWLDNDPFNFDQIDLKASRAMESCIWEMMPLRFHTCSRVSEAAAYLGQSGVPEMEFDMEDLTLIR